MLCLFGFLVLRLVPRNRGLTAQRQAALLQEKLKAANNAQVDLLLLCSIDLKFYPSGKKCSSLFN